MAFKWMFLTSLACGAIHAQAVPDDVTVRAATIISEGTRMAAQVYAPRNPGQATLPTIILCHGWGGIAEHLRPEAIRFARAGYLAVTFDYRGWGKSDGRLIGKLPSDVTELRGVVDPIDQTTDLMNAIHWVQGEALCDKSRIGLWGSSYSGGHIVYAAARDPRIKALVSQVGAMDSRWAIEGERMRQETYRQATARARGEAGYPPPGSKFGTLNGAPILEKAMQYAPIEDIARCGHVAKLFIIAENEELVDNKRHSILAYERATGVKKLVTIPGIKHYGIYSTKRAEAQRLALEWFDQYLKGAKP